MKSTFLTIVVLVIAVITVYSLISKKNSKEEMDAERFKREHQKTPGVVIDVRTKDEYDSGHLKITDRHYDILNGDFGQQLDSLDKNETYYLYCRSGNRSGQAAQMMKARGFEDVYNIGGYSDLVDAGLESE